MALIEKLKNIANAIRSKTNKSEEMTLEQMASAILNIKSITNLQDKQVTITENGTQTIVADEGFEGLNSVEVASDVWEGFNMTSKGVSKDDQDAINNQLKSLIDHSIEVNKTLETKTTWTKDKTLLFLTASMKNATNVSNFCLYKTLFYVKELDFSNVTNAQNFSIESYLGMEMPKFFNLHKCTRITFQNTIFDSAPENITINLGNYADTPTILNLNAMFQGVKTRIASPEKIKITLYGDRCNNLTGFLFVSPLPVTEFEYLDSQNVTSLNGLYMNGPQVETIILGSVENCTDFTSMIGNRNPKTLHFTRWKQVDINFKSSSKLPLESIKYIIWHALNGGNTLGFENQGATSRTLQLHATPYASWETWKLTKPSVEDCEYLGIDETEITKYGELTWEDITLNVKLITIAK